MRIIEPPWRLTYWTFGLGARYVTLPQLLAPLMVKAKRTLHPLRYGMITAKQDVVILAVVVNIN